MLATLPALTRTGGMQSCASLVAACTQPPPAPTLRSVASLLAPTHLQVWHAVLTYLDSFEEQLWEAEDDPQAQERVKEAVAAYKGRD